MDNSNIAIVGISVFSPAGESVDEFWNGISQGRDFITDAPEDVIEPYYFNGEPNSIDRFYCKRGGFMNELKVDPIRYGIMPVAASGTDPEQLISLVGAEHALIDAGVFKKGIPLQQSSIIIGKGNFSGLIQLRSMEIVRIAQQFGELLKSALPSLTDDDISKVKKAYQEKQGRYHADMATGTMPNLIASLVANRFDMHGPAYVVDAACASGIVAINHSINLLRSGQCDLAVAGGMHCGQTAMFWSTFDMLGALSHRQVIAPLSEDADGLLIGQGTGFVVLKTLSKAIEDGDRIYAIINETSICSDGASSHVMVTSVDGQMRLLEETWKKSGMNPERIGYIEAHGTGTVVGDHIEITTLKNFFGDNAKPRAYVGSVKSNIGHTMPAAGMFGVIKTALSLYWRKIPPTLHCERPQPAIFESRFMPPQELIDWDGEQLPLVAGVNAFGFGGVNAHVIMTAHEPDPSTPIKHPEPYPSADPMVSAPDGGIVLTLPRGAPPILKELPELNQVIKNRYGTRGPCDDIPTREYTDPIAEAVDENIRDAITVQREMLGLLEGRRSISGADIPATSRNKIEKPTQAMKTAQAAQVEQAAKTAVAKGSNSRKGVKFEQVLNLNFNDHLYLYDHAIIRQPENWPFSKDLNPVVPFTMTIELLAEIAKEHAPGEKLIKVGNVAAYRWIGLDAPFSAVVKCEWIQQNVLKLDIGGFSSLECTFGDEWPEQPLEYKGEMDIGEEIMKIVPPSFLYDRFSFHGPKYHSLIEYKKICQRGIKGIAQKQEGKASLLDVMGQTLGLFLHLTQTANTISFPVRLKEICFYSDMFDQRGLYEGTTLVTRLTENMIVGDIIFKRGNDIWCIAHDFVGQRFMSPVSTWRAIIKPQFNILAKEIAHGVYYFTDNYQENLMVLLAKRYLSGPDREAYENLKTYKSRHEYLISRIALKDAVRASVRQNNDSMIYPVEFYSTHDENGKPQIHGYGRAAEVVERLHFSLAHKDNAAVAIVSDKPVGIDLEKIEDRSEDFISMVCTDNEIQLIKKAGRPETVTRFWAAKEAYTKMLGTGLEGNPKRYEISEFSDDTLTIGNTVLRTVMLGTEYIVCWCE